MPFPKNSLNGVSNLIETFVRGKLKISKERMYLKNTDGGLGLFDLSEFLSAQACAWIKRASIGNEIWKREIKMAGHGDVFNVRKHRI